MTLARISPHFTEAELVVTDRPELQGMPPADAWWRARIVAAALLEPSRVLVGPLIVNSWWRSPTLNSAVGGSPTSQHLTAEAVDVRPAQVDRLVLMRELLARPELQLDQCVVYELTRHLHMSCTTSRAPRRQFLVELSSGQQVPWTSYGGPLRAAFERLS